MYVRKLRSVFNCWQVMCKSSLLLGLSVVTSKSTDAEKRLLCLRLNGFRSPPPRMYVQCCHGQAGHIQVLSSKLSELEKSYALDCSRYWRSNNTPLSKYPSYCIAKIHWTSPDNPRMTHYQYIHPSVKVSPYTEDTCTLDIPGLIVLHLAMLTIATHL